jgi:hypothetical protein
MTYPIVEKLLLTPDCDVAAMRDACVEAAAHIEALAEAAQRVLDGLNKRIDEAPANCVPLFDGIAELHAALSNLREGGGQ